MRKWIVCIALAVAAGSLAVAFLAAAYSIEHFMSSSPLAELLLIGGALVFALALAVAAVALQWEAGFRYAFNSSAPAGLDSAVWLTRAAIALASIALVSAVVMNQFASLLACSPLAGLPPWTAFLPAAGVAVLGIAARRAASQAGVSTSLGAVALWLVLAASAGLVLMAAIMPSGAQCTVERSPGPDGWSQQAAMRTARVGHRSALLGDGRVLVVGGSSSSGAEVYDPTTDRWTTVAGPRAGSGAFVLVALNDGRALYVDASTAATFDGRSNAWSTVPGRHPAVDTVVTLIEPRVVLLGKSGGEIFDPRNSIWTPIAAPVDPDRITAGTASIRHEAAVAVSGSSVLVPGMPQSYLLDLNTAAWTAVDGVPLTNPRVSVVLGTGQARVIGTGSGEKSIEVTDWDRNKRNWSEPAKLSCGNADPGAPGAEYCYAESATLLPDGSVLILTAGEPMITRSRSRALLLSAAGNRFAMLAPMPEPTRRDYTVTRLSDGRVLVVAGEVLEGGFYNPRPRALRSTATFEVPVNPTFQLTVRGTPAAAPAAPSGCAGKEPRLLGTPVAGAAPGRIAFGGGGSQIWAIHSDGSGLTRMSADGSCDQDPAWSPDGSALAYSSQAGQLEYRIVRVSADGGSQQTLTEGFADYRPAWSPDGSQIAFIRGITGSRIYVMNVDGSGIRAVTSSSLNVELVNHLSWSPDGRSIMAAVDRREQGCRSWSVLMIIRLQDQNAREIARSCSPVSASWSPGGTTALWKALEGDRVPQRRVVHLVNVDGSAPRTLDALTDVDLVTWANDDDHLLIRTLTEQICTVRTDGLERHCLVEDAAMGVTMPSWSSGPR